MIIPKKEEYQLNAAGTGFDLAHDTELRCPACRDRLKRYGRRRRTFKDNSGASRSVMIQRMRCCNESCRKMHHLLPEDLIPYKRYTRKCIEETVTYSTAAVACEDSTRYRWKCWLAGLIAQLEENSGELAAWKQDLQFRIPIQPLRQQKSGWLHQVVRYVLVAKLRWSNP